MRIRMEKCNIHNVKEPCRSCSETERLEGQYFMERVKRESWKNILDRIEDIEDQD